MKKYHKVGKLKFEGNYLILNVDDLEYKVDIRKQSKKLLVADDKEKNNYIISGSGYGIHWPDLDEDLSIDGLIGVVKKHDKNRIAV
ncbi:MAG TPA: DUF2442 domain-containing protein [Spirochaetota bacterium]|nr:DUF2442 domain-containing protein [Spirochaetota bacterium]